MARTIELQCQCGVTLSVPRWRTNQVGQCTHCQQTVVVPSLYRKVDIQDVVEKKPEKKSEKKPEKKWQCPDCGYAGGESFCPKCSREDSPIHCKQCGIANNARDEICRTCQAPLKSERKKEDKWLAAAIIFAVFMGMAGFAYQYRTIIIGKWQSWRNTKAETTNKTAKNTKEKNATREDGKKFKQWQKKWQHFEQKQFPLYIKSRKFDAAKKDFDKLRTEGKNFAESKKNMMQVEKDLIGIQKLFALCYSRLNEYKKRRTIKTFRFVYYTKSKKLKFLKYSGYITKIDKEKQELTLVLKNKKQVTKSYRQFSSKTLESFIGSIIRNNGKVAYHLAILYYYEKRPASCRKYLEKAAKLKYKPAQVRLSQIKENKK